MTASTHETTIDVVADAPAIRIVREFDAPPEKVFRAHTDPALAKQWLGPRGLTMTIERWDAETGGNYRYTHADADGTYRFYGSFHEVRENERIVQTFTYDGYPDGVALETMTFTDLGGGRTRIDGTSMFESTQARDWILASGMEVGVNEGYEQLDELLARP
ncbi:MAG: SRPBCC family protein [Pseudonocardia sp.]|nr:SRPBCC family protein [Pseudonocardia sp.]